MRWLGTLPLRLVIGAAIGWIVLLPAAVIAVPLFEIWRSTDGSLAAVGFGFTPVGAVLISTAILGPPLLLGIVWSRARRGLNPHE